MPNDRAAEGRASWLGVVIAAGAAAVYVPALYTGFNADDYLILARVKSIAAQSDPLGYFKFAFYDYFRPLGFLSFALDWQIWGLNAFGFHLTNVLLHVANSLLVFSLARRLLSPTGAALACALFALHPASHEPVYWIAARFDLLATFFVLVSLFCLTGSQLGARIAGVAAFALALLSKESAISLLVIAPAWDVLLSRRSFRETTRRLIPLLLVAGAYAAARSFGADLDAAGGVRRFPKLVMTAGAIGGVLLLAWARDHRDHSSLRGLTAARVLPITSIAAVAASFLLPSAWVAEKLGFLTHVAFYSVSPILFSSPGPDWFLPESLRQALPHIAIVGSLLLLGSLWLRRSSTSRETAQFLAIFVVAALLPVSSMTGGLRYLYFPTAGIALIAARFTESLRPFPRRITIGIVAIVLAVSAQQLIQAGRAWRDASTVTREGIQLMAGAIERCGADDVLLLTTPVGIGGVYANLTWDAFDVLAGCTPRSFMTLLRVIRTDVHVSLNNPRPDTTELRIANYAGNIVASADLRSFRVPIVAGESTSLDTPAGRLESYAEGTTQVFRLTMTDAARMAKRFYYSEGRIRQ